ncbi:Astacin-like metalloendopeptidase [Aphelenchoides fujianensis]|nr:Astacin-like metalloendopeptidase [Aphelenchoides fujianensis]
MLTHKTSQLYLFLSFFFVHSNAQNFLSLISPFVGSGLETPSAASGSMAGGASPFGSALGGSSGGSPLGGAASMLSGGGGNPLAGGATSMLSSMFGPQPGDEFGNNPFGDFMSLGQAIGGLAKQSPAKAPKKPANRKSRRRRPQRPAGRRNAARLPDSGSWSSEWSDEDEWPAARRRRPAANRRPQISESRDRRPQRRRAGGAAPPPPPSRFMPRRQKRQSNPLELIGAFVPKRPSAGTGRLIDNFGKNFFHFLDELHEYSQLQPDPNAVATTPAPLAPPTLPNPFGWPQPPPFTLLPPAPPQTPPPFGLFTPAPTAPAPSAVAQMTPEFPAAGPNLIARDFGGQSPQSADFLDANNLMRGFLRSMARAAGTPLRPLPARNDGTEAGRNRPLMDQLFESDILLTSKQMKAIVVAEAEKRNGGRRRVKRKVITGGVYRWPKGAPISFSFRDSDKEWRLLIIEGLKLWERETCIRFRENAHAKDRLEFIKGGGCYSSVGKTGGNQKISIGLGCEDKGIVSHEVGHALGFWHEQSRPDRDKYIRLNDKYIAGGTDGNFAKRSDLEADGMGLPYDLGSVMHYGPTAFTLDWDENTIVTKDPKYQHTIGQRRGPSFIDVKQINRLYCFQTCAGTRVQCHNGGYADPNDCNRCKCPPGLGGPSCTHVEQAAHSAITSPLCGGELQAQGFWQHLTHKGKQRCVWRIRAPNARIRFILDKASYQCESTCKSFVEIKHNSDFQQIGFRSCCDEKNVETVSEQAEVIVIHDSAEMSRDGAFTLRYIQDTGAPLPRPPPPAWVPGSENRAFRGVQNKGGVIEKFILNAIPKVRDPNKPVESVLSIFTDYAASSFLGAHRDNKR